MAKSTDSDVVRDQWIWLQTEEISHFVRLNCASIKSVFDEATFRDFFQQKCTEYRENSETLLYNRLQTGFRNVEALHDILGTLKHANTLGSPPFQLWCGWSAIIEVFDNDGNTHKDIC
jgi:hypothetical protein